MAKSTNTPDIQANPDYRRAIDLIDIKARVEGRIADMQAMIDDEFHCIIAERVDEFVTLQAELQTADNELELIALRHPEWFTERQSVKLPNGALKKKHSEELDVADDELTISLLEREEKARAGTTDPFTAADYIRTKRVPNLETLRTLDDETLKRLRIKRISKDNFKAEPTQIDLGKAVKEATEKKVAA
jgi:Gam-like protein